MANPVLVITEQRNNAFRKVSYEIVSEGRRLADQLNSSLETVVFGTDIETMSKNLEKYGADKIYLAESDIFKYYSAEGYTKTLIDLIKNVDPQVILLPATAIGKDLAPRLAAHLKVGLATDCVKLNLENENLQPIRPMYAGKVIATHQFNSAPQLATLRPNVFQATEVDSAKSADVEKVSVPVQQNDLKAVVKEIIASEGGKLDISEADIIVSGGRGLKGPENFKILEELANVLGGAVGASRSAVDAGWRAHADQVGQTGKTVSPILYIACGISGAIQHIAGMSSSKCIVAINKDPEAPIFERADYGIVGDLFEVVPKLTEEFKKVVEN